MTAAAARDLAGLTCVAMAGAAAFFLFPDDLGLLTRIIGASLFVLSLALVTGQAGVATLGHAVPYGIGAYAAGIACVAGLTDPLALIAVGILAGAVAGGLSGAIILRAGGLPQLVLSIALVQLTHEAANKASAVTGGSDGLSGIEPGRLLGLFAFDLWGRTAYLFGLALILVILALLQRLVRSPFGTLCRAIRADPVRVRAMGVPIYPNLIRLYVISGGVAGAGGGLAAVATGVVGLNSVSFDWSAEALVMLVLGGAGSLYGALVGTVAFMLFQHIVAAANPFHWLSMLGGLLIAVVLALPQGLGSLPGRLADLGRRPRRSAA